MNDAMLEAVSRALNLMRRMLANAPTVVDTELVEAWAMVLASAGITAAEVTAALPKVLQSETFFPTPAKFIEAVHPAVNHEVQAELAWQRVRRCVSRFGAYGSLTPADLDGDDKALWCIDRMGWPRLCADLGDDNGAIWAAEFRRLYRLAVEGKGSCAYVAGLLEIDNRAKGLALTPGLCGRPDWTALPGDQPAALPEKTGKLTAMPALTAGQIQGEAA